LIGRGRDALDVAMVTTYGGPRLAQMIVWSDEVLPASSAMAQDAAEKEDSSSL
jgi:hypothetical protein